SKGPPRLARVGREASPRTWGPANGPTAPISTNRGAGRPPRPTINLLLTILILSPLTNACRSAGPKDINRAAPLCCADRSGVGRGPVPDRARARARPGAAAQPDPASQPAICRRPGGSVPSARGGDRVRSAQDRPARARPLPPHDLGRCKHRADALRPDPG